MLFTIDEPEAEVFDSIALQRQMEHLEYAITSSLRKGDVTTNYSSSQMLALLMDVNQDNSKIVIDRSIGRKPEKMQWRFSMNPSLFCLRNRSIRDKG